MKNLLWGLLGMTTCMLSACNKTADTPDYQKMFSCKVNGQLWAPAGDPNPFSGLTPPPIRVIPLSYHDSVDMTATRDIRNKSGVSTTYEFIILANIGLQVNAYTEIKYVNIFNTDHCDLYYPDTTKLNFIKTTAVDKVNRTVSGVFQVECNDAYCQNNIKITEGRFSVKY